MSTERDARGLELARETPNRRRRVWGIDLGTTVSSVAEVTWNTQSLAAGWPTPRCLELRQPAEGNDVTSPRVPSVAAVLPSAQVWVGEGAKRLRARPAEAGLVPFKNLFYDTKNEMGLRRSYHKAPEWIDRPWKVAAVLLEHLHAAAEESAGARPDRTVVTVPASFRVNQRRDTLLAAAQAGLPLGEYDLLDEPTAALLDFISREDPKEIFQGTAEVKALVFDFGGGTCDVSIVTLSVDSGAAGLYASMSAASRYHRIGGGDLDAAIVHEVLIPALCAEAGIDMRDLSWTEKKKVLEPQLLSLAEGLKISLCRKIRRLAASAETTRDDLRRVWSEQPETRCRLAGKTLTLKRPRFTAAKWEAILEPFLDTDMLYARETEYRLSQSVFAPLQDALDRSGVKSRQIGLVLMVGGSSLIPQVREAMEGFFPCARVGGFPDAESARLAVARGAAWHAFFLEATGRPFITPVTSEALAILTQGDVPQQLVSAGTPVPFPSDGSYAVYEGLSIPDAAADELAMEVVCLPTRQVLFKEKWRPGAQPLPADPITIEYRIGSNSEFECRAFLSHQPGDVFEQSVENPLLTVRHEQPVRLRIEEAEERLREKGGPGAEDAQSLERLAQWYMELKQSERAADILKTELRLLGRPDGAVLNLMGLCYKDLGDRDREIKAYLEADKASPGGDASAFNLALTYREMGRYDDACEMARRSERKADRPGPALALQALIESDTNQDSYLESARAALRRFGHPRGMSDWELGWFLACARLARDADAEKAARDERETRNRGMEAPVETTPRPALRETAAKAVGNG